MGVCSKQADLGTIGQHALHGPRVPTYPLHMHLLLVYRALCGNREVKSKRILNVIHTCGFSIWT